jgi:hypothetical protein
MQKWLLFITGFLGWFVVAGLLFYQQGYQIYMLNLICFPVTIISVIGLAIIRDSRWFAFGILAALAVNFIISLILGVMENGLCFVPFFVEYQ